MVKEWIIYHIYLYIYSKFNIIADIAFQNLNMRANRLQLFKIVGSKWSDLKISLKVCWKSSWSSIKNIQLYKILQVNWLPDVQLRLYKHFRQSLKDHIAQSPQWLKHISVTATSGRRGFDNNFDSWISQSLIFQIFNTYDVFHMFWGIYTTIWTDISSPMCCGACVRLLIVRLTVRCAESQDLIHPGRRAEDVQAGTVA
jgi:hypothetical protein